VCFDQQQSCFAEFYLKLGFSLRLSVAEIQSHSNDDAETE